MSEVRYDRLPISRKTDCPIIDIHTHTGILDGLEDYIECMDLFGIARTVMIANEEIVYDLKTRFPNRVEMALMTPYRLLQNPDLLEKEGPGIVEKANDNGCRVIKFWFAPRSRDKWPVLFDDPRFVPMMEVMEKNNMMSIIHVSDPDIWFDGVYADSSKYGTKPDQYTPLENVLKRHPGIRFIGAHLAGNPEDLDFVGQLLDTYPNFYVDTSATKWMVREISRKPEEAKSFITRYRKRILFGTDNYVQPGRDTHLYATRYWAQQILWESDMVVESPIYDDDLGGRPMIHGINLPAGILKDIYFKNAFKLMPGLFSDLSE